MAPIERRGADDLYLCEATVDEQIDTCDEAALLGCEKQYGGRDFLGATDASQRCRGSEPGAQFVGFGGSGNLTIDDRCVDRARADRIDTNTAVLELDGPRPRERAYRRFCRAVSTMGWQAFDPGDRAGQDNAASIRHQWQRLLHGEDESAHIDVECRVVVFRRDLIERTVFDRTRISEENVDRVARLPDDGKQAVQFVESGHVGLHGRHIAADLPHSLVEFRLPPADDEHISALVDKPLCGGKADAAAAARDDGCLVRESIHDGVRVKSLFIRHPLGER
jgi:hypothetical protein